jgi:hypothetical protein
MNQKDLDKIVDIISKATMCTEWKKWIENDIKTKQRLPPFLRCFYNLTSVFEEMGVEDHLWMQTYLSKNAYPHVRGTLLPNFKEDQVKSIPDATEGATLNKKWMKDGGHNGRQCALRIMEVEGWNIANSVLEYTDHFSDSDLNPVTDSFNNSNTWSVLTLFSHPAICVVPVHEKEETKFAFWPTAAPHVNNRHVEYSELIKPNDEGFVHQFVESDTLWDAQSVRILPYCVTNDKGKNEVQLGTIISTTNKNASTVGQPEDPTTSNPNNCFAGELYATDIKFDEVVKLYKALTGNDLVKCASYAQVEDIDDTDKAMLGLSECLKILNSSDYFDGLRATTDWCNLYVAIWMNKFGDFDISDKYFHPTTVNDLVHKTRLLLLSCHSIRFANLEGQKRCVSAVHGTMGFYPQDRIVYHGDLNPEDYAIGNNNNFFNIDVQVDDTILIRNTTKICKNTFKNAGKSVPCRVYHFFTPSKMLTQDVVKCCQRYSKLLVQAGNNEQLRSWINVITMMAEENDIVTALSNTKQHRLAWKKKEMLDKWFSGYRKKFFQLLFLNERQSKCLLDDCSEAVSIKEYLNQSDAEEKFIRAVLTSSDKKKQPIFRTKMYAYSVDSHQPPAPKMALYICHMFVDVAFGSRDGISLIKDITTLQGKRNSNNVFLEGLKFDDFEKDFVPKVC